MLKTVNKFAEKYKSILTNNEYQFLTKRCHKISNFYMLRKLHKSKHINDRNYRNKTYRVYSNGRPVVAGPLFHKSGISKILHSFLKPALPLIPHIVKHSLDFTQRLKKQCQNNTLLSPCDIKSLYTNMRHELFLTAIEYWTENLQNN